MKKCSMMILAAAVSAIPLHAGVESVGTTSATFTKLGSSARAAALGEAYVALADDTGGLAYNPAGMAQMLTGEFEVTHSEWFQNLKYENINAIFSLGDGGMFGITLNTLLAPDLTRTEQIADGSDYENNYRETGQFAPYDLQGAFSYARPLYPKLSGGATLKFLAQNLDSLNAFGIAMDLGLIYETPIKGLKAGFAAQNLGTPIKFYKEGFSLPLLFRLGGNYEVGTTHLKVLPEVDLPMDEDPVFAMGAEYDLDGVFFPRVGYRFNNIFNPWSVGMGIRWSLWGADFSVVPYGELGMTYRGSLSYRFGTPSVNLASSFPFLSSTRASGGGALVNIDCAAPDKVAAWALYIYGGLPRPVILRSFTGRGAPPSQLSWDGKDSKGQAVAEGFYNAVVSLRYANDQVVVSPWLKLEVDNTAPKADLVPVLENLRAGGADIIIPAHFKAKMQAGRSSESWKFEVQDASGKAFRTLEGKGALPEELSWDGKGDRGESFISGQNYSFHLTVSDKLGNVTQPQPQNYRCIFAQ